MSQLLVSAVTVSMCVLSHHSRCDIPVVCVQSNAANGRDPQSTPLHVCQCPSCFTAFAKSNGVIECVPKCDLADCDESTGVCSEAGSGKGKTVCDWGTHLSSPVAMVHSETIAILHDVLHLSNLGWVQGKLSILSLIMTPPADIAGDNQQSFTGVCLQAAWRCGQSCSLLWALLVCLQLEALLCTSIASGHRCTRKSGPSCLSICLWKATEHRRKRRL